jgi:Transketolase, C-terminal subunit
MEFRQALSQKIIELMKKDEKICVLDADLSKPNGTSPIYKLFPERSFDVGIAEANMIGVAAGLSAYGYKPIAFTFAPFATRRVCDQIAVSVAYAKQNVKIVGTDPGIMAELNGGTHMSFEDIAVVRSIPTMVIYDAVDDIQVSQAIEQIMNYNGPVYIRMPRKSSQRVFDENYKFNLFKADIVTEGKDATIIASGIMVNEAKKAVEQLKKEGIEVELISANTIKPLDEETILKSIKKTKHVITCENHNVIGGLYSAVAEMLADKYPLHIDKIGINDQFGQVGKYNDLLKEYHMTDKDIYDMIKKNLNK